MDVDVVFYTRYAENAASSRTRAFEYVAPLGRLGLSASVLSRVDRSGRPETDAFERVIDHARSGAVIVLQKPNLTLPQLKKLLEAGGGRLVVDFDDAIWMGYGHGDPADGIASLEETLRQARLVTTGSAHLAAWARTVTAARVEVLAPSVDLSRYTTVREHEFVGRPLLVWIGSYGNVGDLEIVQPQLRELLDADLIRMHVIADRPPDGPEWHGVEWSPWTLDSEVRLLAESDIGLMPLKNSERTRGRCGYKAVQYAACGLPTVASSVGGAAEVIRDGHTGYAVQTPGEWSDALHALIEDPGLRASLGANARAHVEQQHSIGRNAARLAELLRTVAADFGSWRVLLLGGSSSVGKTTLADEIARATGAEVIGLDRFRTGAHETELSDPVTWRTRSAEEISELLRRAGEAFEPVLLALVDDKLAAAGRWVIEGERVPPATAAMLASQDVRSLFLVEDSPEHIWENLSRRPGDFDLLTARTQQTVVDADHAFGLWIQAEASRLNMPVLRPRPWITILERARILVR